MAAAPAPTGAEGTPPGAPAARLIVMSGLSGAGKTSIAGRLCTDDRFARALTATTREPRGAEQDGVAYHFLTRDEFEAGLAAGDFLEHATVYDRLYGTPRDNVRKILQSGRHCILVVDVQGAASLRRLGVDALYVFVKAPSLAALESRLRGRQSDTDEEIQARLAAVQDELEAEPHFNVVLINDTVETASRTLAARLGIDLAAPAGA